MDHRSPKYVRSGYYKKVCFDHLHTHRSVSKAHRYLPILPQTQYVYCSDVVDYHHLTG